MKVLAAFPEAIKVLEEHLLKAAAAGIDTQSGRKALAILTRYVELFRVMVSLLNPNPILIQLVI